MISSTSPELKSLEKILGHRFKNRALLHTALTHPSFRHEHGEADIPDNQRLEFLGDAVIGMLTAEFLYTHDQEMNEGDMTRFRSMVTSRSALAEVGEDWSIGKLLRLGKGETDSGGALRESNLADAVEALIGAVYDDGGIKATRKLFLRHFTPRLLAHLSRNPNEENPKGALQELTQRRWQKNPDYLIIEERGPDHAREYVASVQVDGKELAQGMGSGKRAAEADAARRALATCQPLDDSASSTVSTSS